MVTSVAGAGPANRSASAAAVPNFNDVRVMAFLPFAIEGNRRGGRSAKPQVARLLPVKSPLFANVPFRFRHKSKDRLSLAVSRG
jgi:hypothetical protein